MSRYPIVACIFARGGSKGLPNKNILEIDGKPLIAHAIEIARASTLVSRVVVSTDDDEIARVADQYGAEIPFMRPSDLAADDSPEWHAWRHAIYELSAQGTDHSIGTFVSLPPTSPLRLVDDVDNCIKTLLQTDADIAITIKDSERNPYFNMVEINEQGYLDLSKALPDIVSHRQAAPQVYDITTVAYAAKPSFILSANSIFEGKVKAHLVPAERAIDIDTELDFEVAKFLYSIARAKSIR
jgi:N,N'-diacetyl-8-epilegionaminate cytidylyltransferase